MKTIGVILKEARTRKKLSRKRLGERTKIKEAFIEAIEKEQWNKLPDYPVIYGFVRSIADTLKIERKQALAVLRRDYPPKKLAVNPKPDVSSRFTWSPRMTFIVGIVVVVLAICTYLIFQYVSFISPPHLKVLTPNENDVVANKELTVKGITDPDVTIKVNNQPVLVGDDGNFSVNLNIFEGTKEIVVIAKSRSGKETVIRRKINVELEGSTQ